MPLAATGHRTALHIPALDGIRGAAALLVIVSHLPVIGLAAHAPAYAGSVGVMTFFTLSGFLMGHLYLFRPFDGATMWRYLVARAARVLPLFYAVVIGAYLLSEAMGPSFTYHLTTTQLWRHLALIGSAYVFWSIPPEIEFYIVFLLPWWLLASGRLRPLVPLLLLGTTLLIMAHPFFPGVTVFNKLHIFLAGVAAAWVRSTLGPARMPPLPIVAAQLLGLVLVVLLAAGALPSGPAAVPTNPTGGRLYDSVPLAMLFASILLAFTIRTRLADTLFGNRLMAQLGAYSFSLYLLHEPVMAGVHTLAERAGTPGWLQLAAAFATLLLICAAVHRLFERPAQQWLRHTLLQPRRLTPA